MTGKAKTKEQHIEEARAVASNLLEVLDARRVGARWEVFCRCRNCGRERWILKNNLSRMDGCGCRRGQKARAATPRELLNAYARRLGRTLSNPWALDPDEFEQTIKEARALYRELQNQKEI